MQSVLQTMVDEKIGPGVKKKEFLDLLTLRLNMNGGIALRSYFDAIKTALELAGVKEGSSIVTSVLSPQIYKIAAKKLGAKIVLADINSENGCLSASSALEAIGKGAIAVLLHEPCCQIPYGEDYSLLNVPIIEDISESFGSFYDEFFAGSFGDIVICAFEQEHIVSCGGGAAILYTDRVYKELIKNLYKDISKYEEMPDLNASLGIIQLAEIDGYLLRRQEIFEMFKKALLKTNHKLFGISDLDFSPNAWIFPVVLDSKPEDIIAFAKKYNVLCKPLFDNSIGSDSKEKFALYPGATSALLRAIAFPVYPFLKSSDIDTLVKVISHLP
ncbi:MAG: DegT/DnrJ/EryC1/StrS aminotransferase family protein [Spirochaetaceae bacterium]|nr:DegT/DnrJ/EryC1/StrS aminotransferase family protein [Spirochaetaceae bacterium]